MKNYQLCDALTQCIIHCGNCVVVFMIAIHCKNHIHRERRFAYVDQQARGHTPRTPLQILDLRCAKGWKHKQRCRKTERQQTRETPHVFYALFRSH